MRQLVTGLLLLSIASSAAAETCKLDVYFVDQDPTTNIRAAPSGQAKVVARVDPANAVATIREARGGWFRVDRVIDYENDKPLFRGSGWVHASVLGLSVGSGGESGPKLYAQPTTRSAVVQKLTPDGNILDLVDCRGDWVKVRVDKKKTGWMAPSAQCANPFTTCA
jgi:SH3-like domain-containing protein